VLRKSIPIVNRDPVIDGKVDRIWKTGAAIPISNLISVPKDVSKSIRATLSLLSNGKDLFALIRVWDNEIKYCKPFTDYAWIENDKHETVWEMSDFYCLYAGGSLKNQAIQNDLTLSAGKYTLKYSTDESHSSKSWDSPPPTTTFYGVRIYKR
jgi:hypothetical protein